MRDLAGKTAFITGGASGLGLAMAHSFCAAGMKVAIADIEPAALQKAEAQLRPSNAEVLALQLDVTDRAAMAQAADRTEQAFGKVHVVCNNAGVAVAGTVDGMTYADWDWVVGVNLQGVINGVQTFLERIKSHGEGGHFVNTASVAGLLPFPGLSVYNTAKYAVLGLSEAMRIDLAAHGIGVSVLCPGVVNTNIFDSGRNRPAALQSDASEGSVDLAEQLPDDEQSARIQALLANALEPSVIGDMVLHAIQEDEPYIFSHPEFAEMAVARHQDMLSAFERWCSYREAQGI